MSFEMDMPEDLGPQGNFLREPGTYHCAVTSIAEGHGPKGNPIDGFTVGLDVLAGTTAGQEGKVFNLTIFGPKLNGTDKGNRMARMKQGAFAIASNIVGLAKLGQRVSVDLDKAAGQQVVVKLVKDEREGSEGNDYLQLNYADIWHVDDPRCKDVPKKAEAIAMIPESGRHKPEEFDALRPHKGNSKPQSSKKSAGQTQLATSKVSFDDL